MLNNVLDIIYEIYLADLNIQISQASYVAIDADETTDISNKSQFVIILRYVLESEPIERFLKFVEVHDRSGSGLADVILQELQHFNLGRRLIAQAYDGATVMSGCHRGVQTIVREIYPYAYYVHCASHLAT